MIETAEPLIIEEEGIDRYQKPARYLSYKKPLKNRQGKIVGLIGSSLNIENLKLKEQKLLEQKQILQSYYQQVINLMPGNVYWKDSNGRYLGCNENQANMLGIQSPEEIIGKTTNEIVRSDLSDAIIKTDQKVMNSQKPDRKSVV